METPLTTGFAQIFSCCPDNLSCPKFGGAARLCLRLRCLRSAYDLVKTRLSESEAGSGRINQSFPRFVIGLVILLLLPTPIPTPTIWFSLDHKRNVGEGVVSGIGTLFSLDHKLYTSDNDSDSVASENQGSS